MHKKIIALFCMTLIVFTGTSNLFSNPLHNCKMTKPENKDQCSMAMEKMSCCPPEQQEKTCTCPEMNTHNDFPKETSPAVFVSNFNYSFDFIITGFFVTISQPEIVKQYPPAKNIYLTSNDNKIYKSVHAFLI